MMVVFECVGWVVDFAGWCFSCELRFCVGCALICLCRFWLLFFGVGLWLVCLIWCFGCWTGCLVVDCGFHDFGW